MTKPSPCLKVLKVEGEKTLALTNKLGLTDKTLLIQRTADFLCIPLVRQPDGSELEQLKNQLPTLELTTQVFPEKVQREKTLIEVLADELPPHLVAIVPRALDVVGDIAIFEVPPELEPHKTTLGNAILKVHTNVHTVLSKAGAVSGTYRIRNLEYLVGEHKTETIHKEHGCSYYVDLAKAYFSPRLSTEHLRVALLVQDGETVVDLFAGVGPFAIPIAKKHPDTKVYAVDINPDAVALLERNIRLNRVESRVYPIVGDARQIVQEKLAGKADRVIMNLPETASKFIYVACQAVKPEGGMVHFYGFVKHPETVEDFEKSFCEAVEKADRKVNDFLCAKKVRETAPYQWQVVLDAKIS
jgi:tRNA (guanine37-N1)-methyltransferase